MPGRAASGTPWGESAGSVAMNDCQEVPHHDQVCRGVRLRWPGGSLLGLLRRVMNASISSPALLGLTAPSGVTRMRCSPWSCRGQFCRLSEPARLTRAAQHEGAGILRGDQRVIRLVAPVPVGRVAVILANACGNSLLLIASSSFRSTRSVGPMSFRCCRGSHGVQVVPIDGQGDRVASASQHGVVGLQAVLPPWSRTREGVRNCPT